VTCAVLKCSVQVVIRLSVNMGREPGPSASNISRKGVYFGILKHCAQHLN
jgi:hypothetical protein